MALIPTLLVPVALSQIWRRYLPGRSVPVAPAQDTVPAPTGPPGTIVCVKHGSSRGAPRMVLYIATFALCELLSFSTTLVAVIMILAGRVNLIGVSATSLSQQGGPH